MLKYTMYVQTRPGCYVGGPGHPAGRCVRSSTLVLSRRQFQPANRGNLAAGCALLDDGLLDVMLAFDLKRRQLPTLLPKTLKSDIILHPLVKYLQTRAISITASPTTPIQADGEIIAKTATEINYSIIAHKLRVIV